MRALTFRQPWAELLLNGRKRYELRSRPPRVRERVCVHAGMDVEVRAATLAGLEPRDLVRGALICTVAIVGCGPFTLEIANELREAGVDFDDWLPRLFA